jgi:hypothetical protein
MKIALTNLVHLIQQDDRIGPARFSERLDDKAWSTGDVGTPVASDFRLVPHAAQGNALEGSIKRLSDGLAQGCLAGAGWSDKPIICGMYAYAKEANINQWGTYRSMGPLTRFFFEGV